ncbi:MAG: sigma-54-dependent Fis family transcriptional regulator [Planctomycetes bacterium]|nr:sigma-54-dependent Fis family transcriptional regulator [Planctomycetota bacterium]
MRILLVDDHPEVRQSLGAFIEQLGHEALQCDNAPAAVATARKERPDLILSDLRMPGMDGLHLLAALEQLDHPPPLALMTAFGDADTAIAALRQGAVDYLRKPIDVRELHRLIERISSLTPTANVISPTTTVTPVIREEADGLVIHGENFARVIALADRLHAAHDLPCLIEGETGSGKELIARRIHHGGKPRISSPFVAVNCAAIAPGLFEAELFGYAAGSFTGALAGGAQGKLALASGGTLLLDELADLPLDQQAKLLRVLEERTWYPVGSNQLQHLKARVVCACNADLLDLVGRHRFREDLYYRLKVGHVRIPPLRERREDIVPLAQVFMGRIRRTRGRGFQRLSSDAAQVLIGYPWPGNVRQLHHLLEQAGMLHDGAVLDVGPLRELLPELVPPAVTGTAAVLVPAVVTSPVAAIASAPAASNGVMSAPPLDQASIVLPDGNFDLDTWTRTVVQAALAKHHGSPVRTAAYLGVTRKVLYTLRKRYGLIDVGEEEPT